MVGTGTALSGANALNSLSDDVARLVGAPLGGALTANASLSALLVPFGLTTLGGTGPVGLVLSGPAGPALAESTSARTTAYVVTAVAAVYATSTPYVHQPFAR